MENKPPAVDYNMISQMYDTVRHADFEIARLLVAEAQLAATSSVLDIGCGTGNYADLLQRLTSAHVFGIDPADGMLHAARLKNTAITFTRADAAHLPYDDTAFDFVYMTDVIHHIQNLGAMFAEIQRALKPQGKVCIVTQSHSQIERRPITTFFPSTAPADKARYPDIQQIVELGEQSGLTYVKTDLIFTEDPITLDHSFLELVRNKGYSMLHLIAVGEYTSGLKQLEEQLASGAIAGRRAGESMVWFKK